MTDKDLADRVKSLVVELNRAHSDLDAAVADAKAQGLLVDLLPGAGCELRILGDNASRMVHPAYRVEIRRQLYPAPEGGA